MEKNGFILIDKKIGDSSFKALSEIKKLYNTKKVGHTGTLDPFASGLLIVGVNAYTKLIPLLEKANKTYTGIIKLGKQTSTFDLEGDVTNESKIPKLSKKDIEDEIKKNFLGDIEQMPPKYSALKIDGKRLYEYARKNEEVEIKPRMKKVFKFNIEYKKDDEIEFEIEVSSGTYIRSIANDLAINLNTFGHLTKLRRTKINNIDIKDNSKEYKFCDVTKIIDTKMVEVSDAILADIKHGKEITLKETEEIILAINKKNIIAILEKVDNIYKVKRGI
jgi:tRNA pseudouridine55 synthase